MKNIFLIVVVIMFTFFNCAGQGLKQPIVNVAHKNFNPRFDRNRIELVYKLPHYESPIYFYKNQLRVSIAKGVKFWITYNDMALIQKAAENRMSKYKSSMAATFRIRIPWIKK